MSKSSNLYKKKFTWKGKASKSTKVGINVRTVRWKHEVKSGFVVYHVNSKSQSFVEQNMIILLHRPSPPHKFLVKF